jgi:hypothetical protein
LLARFNFLQINFHSKPLMLECRGVQVKSMNFSVELPKSFVELERVI